MNRRSFIQASLALPATGRLLAQGAKSDNWRTFEGTTRVEVLKPAGTTRVSVPAALTIPTPYQKTLANTFHCEGGTAKMVESKEDGLAMVTAEFPDGVKPALTVISRVATRDWSVNLAAPAKGQVASTVELQHFLRATKFLPTDGIVKQTADEIAKGASTDLDKARAIYEWIVENTHTAMRRCAAAGRATSGTCWSRRIWAGNAPI
jgi:hypothetical protein